MWVITYCDSLHILHHKFAGEAHCTPAVEIESLQQHPITWYVTYILPGLRPSRRTKGGANSLDVHSIHLGIGQRAIIPLKMVFIVQDYMRKEVNATKGLEGLAQRLKNFDYGPELVVNNVKIDGEVYNLDEPSANFLAVSIGSEEGSCPFLYAYHEELSGWVNHSKVLHYANDKSLEQSDSKSFEGLRTKFRLAELEPEVAHIDQTRLELLLSDGSTRWLAPNIDVLAEQDENYLRLFWGEEGEFEFFLPDDIKAEHVTRSTLHVTGYYDRYGKLLAERNKRIWRSGFRPSIQSKPSRLQRCSTR